MNIDLIGTWAGQVYLALEASESHVLEFKQVKKVTKLKKDEIMTALGWLGREGKIILTNTDSDIVISLL